MKKLFTLNTGSKMYGTDHPESDTDIKHIVLPDLDDLLMGKRVVTIEKKTNSKANTKNTKDDVDEKFVPIQEFAKQFLIGDTEAMETAFAIEGNHCGQTFYTEHGSHISFDEANDPDTEQTCSQYPWLFIEFVRELRTKFLTSQIKSMVSYLINQSQLYSLKGDRLNAAKAVLAALTHCGLLTTQQVRSLKDVRLSVFAEATDIDPFGSALQDYPEYFVKTEYDIGQDRKAPCFKILGRTLPFTNSLEKSLEVVNSLIKSYGSRAERASEEGKDWKAYMHAMRIVDEGLMLLREGRLEFPLEKGHVERLWQIRRGEVDYEAIKQEFEFKVDLLSDLEKTTHLPPMTQELKDEFDPWMKKWLRRFYGIK